MNNIEKRILKLRELINYQNEIYFDNGKDNSITDPLYDQLLNELKELEKEYPQYKKIDSPTNNLGETITNTFENIKHEIPMLSLDKVLSFDAFINWLKNAIEIKNINEFMFEYKYDGLANSLIYENNELICASTRGNGKVGKNNFETAKLIPNIPMHISKEKINYKKIEIRGEILLLKEGLEKINEISDKKYQNVRNAAAAILRNKIPNSDFIKYLRFNPYGLYLDGELVESYDFNMKILNEIFNVKNFTVLKTIKNLTQDNINELKVMFDKIADDRDSIPFDIDGIVIKSNYYGDWERLGVGNKYPHYAVAYKFPPMQQISIIEDVEWLLGGKGTITPRAKITPVEIGGTIVTNPTLHNINNIKSLDLKIGDHVIVSRHGDVIPEIDSVIKELRTGEEKEIVIPKCCPICGEVLTYKGDFLRCDNTFCEGRKLSKIENFINAMEIENFGSALISKLYEDKKINTFIDIYNLKKEDIANLDKMGEKSAEKVINNIEKSRNNTLDKIINGLMIPYVSNEKSKILMDYYKTLDNFKNCKYEELINLNSFGEVICDNIINFLNNKEHIELINTLIKIGIGNRVEKKCNGVLNDLSFCFTGKLSLSRSKFEELIKNNGGIISSIKNSTDYMVIGDGAKDHKIDKANKLNITVINEEDFYNKFGL